MQDSTSTILRMFEQNLERLHQGLEATRPIIENLKAVLALQWFLGNVAILILFLIGIRLYFFDLKALKAFKPEYRLPKRWVITFGLSFLIGILAFNIFPLGIDLKVDANVASRIHQ